MKNNPYRIDKYYKYTLQESHELNKAHKELRFGKFLDQRSEFVYLGIIQLIHRNIGTPYMPFEECAVTVRQHNEILRFFPKFLKKLGRFIETYKGLDRSLYVAWHEKITELYNQFKEKKPYFND
ncbi:hypothetical protein [Parasutterella excrementihominis]|uniref:hypothetical protein n=1 Tax=Parasutterella excrementihominis TaxID=487175 RepID=UPI00242C866B|nr:hypothetical protein [Parasutterella excrementihominis]